MVNKNISSLNLSITTRCNLDCDYCYLRGLKSEDMSLKTACTAIDKLHPDTIIFYGGEPLLKFELINDIVEYAKRKYRIKKFMIVTNGTLFSKKIVDFMQSNDFRIIISLDGERKSHDAHRKFLNGQSSYDVIFNNIMLLKSYGINPGINYTVNYNTIVGMATNVHALICKHKVNVNLGYVIDEKKITSKYKKMYENEMIKFTNIYLSKMLFMRMININPFDIYFFKLLENKMTDRNLFRLRCNMDGRLTVMPDGTLYPCNTCMSLPKKHLQKCILGNIFSKDDFLSRYFYFVENFKLNDLIVIKHKKFQNSNRVCLLSSKNPIERLEFEMRIMNVVVGIFKKYINEFSSSKGLKELCKHKKQIIFN
ncbi:MAG: radical SAM protein [Candidatus Omnitrophica bacterium]|nr:radical SAM protein [Candidatus Omnitrophota bacterium]MDD5352615.1 radical SAM protein [Candidatus Omnitrophota bacterium]MDD5550213.1 radical SAM protein [Candidatus Omnitrophota bacterium]